MPPKSPMVSFNNQQPPSSPAARSPAFHQSLGQPPNSPMTNQQYQSSNSPMPISPMISQTHSPMSMRRPPSASGSPAMPDRPTSVENPGTPRTPYTPQNDGQLMQENMHASPMGQSYMDGGGGNPRNSNNPIPSDGGGGNTRDPANPIPFPPEKFTYFKLGLRGGSPMWGGFGRGAKRVPTPPASATATSGATPKPATPTPITPEGTVGGAPLKNKKESHLSKVSILKKKSPAKTNLQSFTGNKVSSLVSSDYNEFEDSSSPPPGTPPPMATTSRNSIQKTLPKKILDDSKDKMRERIMILHSPEHKQLHEIMDYDDDNNTVLSGEVSLNSVAQQNDADEIEIETLSQNDLTEDLSSPLESDQITDEYLLFPGNMVVEEEVEEFQGENMHIVIRSPTTSDDEYIMQGKTKKYNIVSTDQLLSLNDPDPDSPEEMNVDHFTEPSEEDANFEEGEILITPEESISTKEDFEELIDEGSRKEKLKNEAKTTKHINEIHKYAAPNVFSFPPKTTATSSAQVTPTNSPRITNIHKLPSKISLITSPIVQNIMKTDNSAKEVILAQNAKLVNTTQTTKVTSIILTHSPVRSNVLSPKIVTAAGSPAITIVSANSSQIASMLPTSKFTVPVISASAVRHLQNVKVIDKSISLTTHDSGLPKKIFEDDSVSPDSSFNYEDDSKSKDSSDEKSKTDSPPVEESKPPVFPKTETFRIIKAVKSDNIVMFNKTTQNSKEKSEDDLQKQDKRDIPIVHKLENVKISNLIAKPQRVPSPIIARTSSPVIIHNTPELKMTAQVVQETSQNRRQITATTDADENAADDTKSVVISIPSPTPSQEQMLDDIALREYESRRHDTGIPGFDSIEDVLDMIENITAESPSILEQKVLKTTTSQSFNSPTCTTVMTTAEDNKPKPAPVKPETTQIQVAVTATTKSSTVPQLSPLSPTDMTTNMANASQQLRNLLSLQTSTTSSSTNSNAVKAVTTQKIINVSQISTTSTGARIIQQQVPNVTTINTVIVPNMKQIPVTNVQKIVPTRPQTFVTQTSNVTTSSVNHNLQNFLTNRTVGGIHLMPDHPKLPPVTTVANSQQNIVMATQTTSNMKTSSISTSTTSNGDSRKPSLTLTAMLQNQPAATPTTKTTPDSITAASLLATPVSISRGFNTALVQAQPNAVVTSPVTTTNANPQTSSVITTGTFRSISSTNLLHTQLTKVKTKAVEEVKEIKIEDKSEEINNTEDKNGSVSNVKVEQLGGCKFSNIQAPFSNRVTEDSQNVLLKKLLQNTACASTQTPVPSLTTSTAVVAPTSQNISNTDSLITKTVTPTLSSLLPVVKTEPQPVTTPPQPPKPPPPQRMPIRETSFVSSPIQVQTTSAATTVATQQLHIDVKKCLPPSRTPSRDDLLSPQTPRSSCSQDSTSLQTPPLTVKKEPSSLPHQSPVPTPQDVKKEFLDESSQHSEVSDHSRPDLHVKEEMDTMDHERLLAEKEELRRQKRRQYQQKRRQNQNMNKEAAGSQPKKRPRKNSKIEEDYDSYIDGVLAQLRPLPMTVSEPILNRNYGVVPVFGSGDMSKLGTRDYDSRFGDLTGTYGNAVVPGFTDFYSTKPHGDEDPLPEIPPVSTQRGFYDQEFPPIRFDSEEDRRFDLFARDDTPESVLSSSSPECTSWDPVNKFRGLKLISDDDSDEDEATPKDRMSPEIPLIAPIPIRLKPAGVYLKDYTEVSVYSFGICRYI